MGRRVGAEVSVNTSLNVGSPIVQTPEQAIACLKRSKGITGLVMISADGETIMAWHNVHQPPKDQGRTLLNMIESWKEEEVNTSNKKDATITKSTNR
jgi:carbamoyltransferase